MSPRDVLQALQRAGVTDVSDADVTRAAYSTDASLYRVVPQVVARPRHRDELAAILSVARETGTPVTMRGAGTSIAGNAVGTGIVVDTRKHLHRVLEVDGEARTARVEPGTVHADLQRAAAPHGVRFGPDPSTHPRCTIGGMIGNNACGSRALGYGRTSDNVLGLDVLWGDGTTATLAAGTEPTDPVSRRLLDLVAADLGHVRQHFGRFTRQVSGYSLEHLLPEHGRDVGRFLVGSEGTLGVVLGATVRMVEEEPRRLVVLGYPSMVEAADAVPGILAGAREQGLGLVACEGLDARIVELVRGAGKAVPELPRGAGWLFVETTGEGTLPPAGELSRLAVPDAAAAAALWRIREDGAGLAARSLSRPAYAGWEDAAVPPEKLGTWLREFDEVLREFDLDGVPYGHFGDGCVHARIDFPFDGDAPDGGRRVFREFLEAATDRIVALGGSLSGEHGDGRARSELLSRMYDADSLRLFGAAKAACDPDGLLNPGVLVDPAPVDADLRPARPVAKVPTLLRFVEDGGSMGRAVHRCTGVGKCVAGPGTGPASSVMCPSWQATRDEKDSTRGRSRVLQEALDGTLVQGLADPAVHDALDLCLSCKGCASDCPTGVDMATYKSEVLHQTYRGKRRPRTHYTLGWLPALVRLAPQRFGRGLAGRAMGAGPLVRAAARLAGVDPRRSLPRVAPRTARSLLGTRELPPAGVPAGSPAGVAAGTAAVAAAGAAAQVDVWIWADTFTDHFRPSAAQAAIRLLGEAGLTAALVGPDACCGLTWISTGQLDKARSTMQETVATLAPYVASGTPVVALEPSCLATLRSDAVQLSDDPRAEEVAGGVLSLAELLARLEAERGWQPPDLSGVEVVAQPHCHHQSVVGWEADARLLQRAGATVTRVGGCCGLAGNFGMEQGHYEVSVAVAELQLLPAVRTNPRAVVLADGLSCRHQLDDLADVRALHLAELLAGDR
ncbi:FAD-binding and (Fe-S)-binding domain-containing protein [Nocardioides solisilvae]|uniref:FAD-binding and (Fe-S)-binding domain-containing protein n=1 Tax=Nocardioides solisilvae TaxID=1542435 RepID=UPI000D740CA0|nr:FAD-binding and (Fe-S)-binding domain-containing protein [Nocardioides solisilvae]